jgi:hypothetical protein
MFQQGIESGILLPGYFQQTRHHGGRIFPPQGPLFQLRKKSTGRGPMNKPMNIRQDVASPQTFRYITPAFFGPSQDQIAKQALVLLGERLIKNRSPSWPGQHGGGQTGGTAGPDCLARLCRHWPLISTLPTGKMILSSWVFFLIDAFLTGLLPRFWEILIDDPIKLALWKPGRLGEIYKYTLSYEKAWGRLKN